MFKMKNLGSFKNTLDYLDDLGKPPKMSFLQSQAQLGVDALIAATPIETGKTAAQWTYEIVYDAKGFSIYWDNLNKTASGTSIAILIQYGHATKNGGYVPGKDFINPAIKPVFDKIVTTLWSEVN